LTHDKGKSVRTIVAVVVAAVVLLAIGLPCIYVWQKRAQKTEQLKTELRLLEAQIQTGLSHNDFLAQVARVRAAYLAARETLNESQEAQYERLDSCLKACSSFFDKKQSLVDRYPDQEFSEFDDFIEPFATRFGLSKRLGIREVAKYEALIDGARSLGEKSLGYSFYESFQRVLSDTTEDIEAFLNDQPCPWPK
jgi:outer membrane murein-binding lipoprotein Lpp